MIVLTFGRITILGGKTVDVAVNDVARRLTILARPAFDVSELGIEPDLEPFAPT
jgi:hypothetical protein